MRNILTHLFFALFFILSFQACKGSSAGGAVDFSVSTVSVAPNTGLAANGSTAALITVTVRNSAGQPIAGKSVTIEATGSGNTLSQPSASTDVNGIATGSIVSTVAEAKTLTLFVQEADEPSPLALTQTPSVSFGSLFGSAKNTPVGSTPRGISSGDLNGDGNIDYAVANGGSASVSVLLALNLGSGDIALAPLAFTVGTTPTATVMADFTNDGKLDLAVANSAANSVSILTGKGNGNFDPPTDSGGLPLPFPIVPVGVNPQAIASADVNGDSSFDLMTVNQTPGTVSVLLGNGNGTFGTKTDFTVGATAVAIAVGDLNGSGGADFAVANSGANSVSILLNNGSGSFSAGTSLTTTAPPVAIALGDYNRDGTLDVVTANNTGTAAQRISLFSGNGDGTFDPESLLDITGTTAAVVLVDVNGNGILDLLTTSGNNLAVRLGDGLGTFASQVAFVTGNTPSSIATGDSSGDGILEVLTANSASSNVSLFTIP